MTLFNIIHPARYLTTDPDISMKDSSTKNQNGVDSIPVTPTKIVKPVGSVQHA